MVNRLKGQLDTLVNNPYVLAYWCAKCAIKAKCQSDIFVWQDTKTNKFYSSCYGRHYTNIRNHEKLFYGKKGEKNARRKYDIARFKGKVPEQLFLSYCTKGKSKATG